MTTLSGSHRAAQAWHGKGKEAGRLAIIDCSICAKDGRVAKHSECSRRPSVPCRCCCTEHQAADHYVEYKSWQTDCCGCCNEERSSHHSLQHLPDLFAKACFARSMGAASCRHHDSHVYASLPVFQHYQRLPAINMMWTACKHDSSIGRF